MELTEQEKLAVKVRRAIVAAGPAVGYPEAIIDGVTLRICRLHDAHPSHPTGHGWYCPDLCGMELYNLLQSARKKGAKI